ncbi:hypothetical protein, partial [Pseudomonas viridiflava]|uniref:hypothetical protein n=1 Tax=Pseudomonas viridiflava TaxID=33069 RepID=UPI0019D2FBB2
NGYVIAILDPRSVFVRERYIRPVGYLGRRVNSVAQVPYCLITNIKCGLGIASECVTNLQAFDLLSKASMAFILANYRNNMFV